MRWKVYVEGHDFDLDSLLALFPSDAASSDRLLCDRTESGTYFATPRLDDVTDPGEMHRLAEQMVRELNGTARVLDRTFSPVTLVGRYEDESGKNVQIVAVDTIEVRSQVGSVVVTGGAPQLSPPPPPGPDYLKLASRNQNVAEALALMGGPAPPGWYELYKLYEIISADLGGGQEQLVRRGWTNKADLSSFTASANRQDVSGPDARHARTLGAPPRRTTTLPAAREFIRALTQQWLESLT